MPVVSEGTYKPAWAKTVATNAAFLQQLLESPTLQQIATNTRSVVTKIYKVSIRPDEDFVFVYDYDTRSKCNIIQYGVRIKTFKIVGLREFNTLGQVSVWRNLAYSLLPSGFAAWVFKTILFPVYGNVISDSSQSLKGKDFWTRRIDEELQGGLHVYALALEPKRGNVQQLEEIHKITNLREVDRYYSVLPDIGGDYYRLLLTKQLLD